ncbi:MAG: hypothetical protein LKJ17_12155 [Oscillospiraceae bacterium]|jgi:hypothetical protein|nr:hypothetical protein [Oscillospiraceae bacterium]
MAKPGENDKIIVHTPKGCMFTHKLKSGKNKGKAVIKFEWKKGFGAKQTKHFSSAQKFVDSETLRLDAPYIPFQTGTLIKSGKLGTVIGSGEVNYVAPYAAKQYYTTAQSRPYDAQRGGMWFERMKADHKGEIIRGAKKKAGGK